MTKYIAHELDEDDASWGAEPDVIINGVGYRLEEQVVEKFKDRDLVEVKTFNSWVIGNVGCEPGEKPLTRKTNTQMRYQGNDFVWINGRGWWHLNNVRKFRER